MLKIIVNIFYQPVQQLVEILNSNAGIYVPVNGGASLKNIDTCVQNLVFDDDFNGNISSHNAKLNEMTSIWWAWKNIVRLGNPDYIGFNHYRRFFDLNDITTFAGVDMYVAKPIICSYTLEQQYAYYHFMDDLRICQNVIDFIYPGDGIKFMTYLREHTNNFAPMNMFVMKNRIFCEWCDYVFPILFGLETAINVDDRDNYQKRAVCFLCERIFGWWAFEKSKTCRFVELNVIEHLEFKNNSLNERGTY